MIDPLTMTLDLACPVDHAFTTWTARMDTWWPRDHTVSGENGAVIIVQGRVGGRIFERTGDGIEHDWGQVTAWQPPALFSYTWHLGQDPANATDVQVQFAPHGADRTVVTIEHRGWERLGDPDLWRHRNQIGWNSLLPHFLAAITRGDR